MSNNHWEGVYEAAMLALLNQRGMMPFAAYNWRPCIAPHYWVRNMYWMEYIWTNSRGPTLPTPSFSCRTLSRVPSREPTLFDWSIFWGWCY